MRTEYWIMAFGLCCIIPALLLTAGAIFVIRRGQQLITPDIGELQERFARLKAQNPNAAPGVLVQKIIQQQAVRSGVIGAITSVGGLPVLPFGLTADVYATARLHNATLHFIAWAYGADTEAEVLKLNDALALRTSNVTNAIVSYAPGMAQRVYREIMMMVLQKSFAKVIPGIGLFIGFIVNYAIAQGIGRAAARWYSTQTAQPQPNVM